jgi:hypothetical protein
MKTTSFLAMTAALSIMAGTSAAIAGDTVEIEKTVVIVKQDIDTDVTINKNKINQLAIVNNEAPSVSAINTKFSKNLNNLTNINNIALNVANAGNIDVKGSAETGDITGHGNSGSSVSAVGAAAGISISSISTTKRY